jgi:hypothetical protein
MHCNTATGTSYKTQQSEVGNICLKTGIYFCYFPQIKFLYAFPVRGEASLNRATGN